MRNPSGILPLLVLFVAAWLGAWHLTARHHAQDVGHPRVPAGEAGGGRRQGVSARDGGAATDALEAMRWYNNQRAYPSGVIPPDWREKALQHIEAGSFQKTSVPNALGWVSVGPNNLGGRVRSIVVDPVHPSTVYCGSVSGGIWKTTNAGGSWFPVSDNAPNLVISSMVIDPAHPDTLYAATGEGFQNIDALRGAGVLKSTDGGGSWSLLSNFLNPPPVGLYITKLVLRPDNPSTLFAAMLGGIWKTTNGGTSWAKLTIATVSTGCTDLVMDPSNPATLYASFGIRLSDGIYKTTNSGSTWQKLTNGFPSQNIHRISLAISQSNPSILYASVADSNDGTHSIQKTTDGGASWFAAATRAPYDSLLHATHLGNQGWYNNVIAVHPTNPNLVYAGGINTFRSTNGGANWSMMTFGYSGSSRPFMHVDQHAIVFDPVDPSTIYFGNDGGVYKTTDGGNAVANIDNDLAITQFYSGAVHPTNEVYYGGAQDIGIMKSGAIPAWTVPFTGDGGVTLVDFANPATVYSEYVFLTILKSTNSGASFAKSMNGIPVVGSGISDGASDRCDFIAPLAMDPGNSQVLLAGTYRVFRSTDAGLTWSSFSASAGPGGDVTGDGSGGQGSDGAVVTALAIAKSSSATTYVGTGIANSAFGSATGSTASRVWVATSSTNGGASWTNVTGGVLPNRYVRAIAIDPTNANRAFVCYSGYGTGHVYRTTNRGALWTDVSSNLPDIPVNTMVIDPASTNHLIIGTDLGVFESLDGGTSWEQQNTGLANVCVLDLDLRSDGYCFASTHGRGMFKTTAPISAALSPHLTVSIHQNPVLTPFVDVYLLSDTALSPAPPSARIRIGTAVSDSVPMALSSPQVYKGSYMFRASGTASLSFLVNDAAGLPMFTQRSFQVQLLKQGVAQTVSSHDGAASVDLSAEALPEEMVMTIIPADAEKDTSCALVSLAYAVGPPRALPADVTVRFRFDAGAGSEDLLSIVRWNGSAWTPLPSVIDKAGRTVSARVALLGTFALARARDRAATGPPAVPSGFALAQNYPNPFNPSTTIRYTLGERSRITLAVYTLSGGLLKTLVDARQQDAGEQHVSWDSRDASGLPAASGVYLYRLTVSGESGVQYTSTKKMLIVK